VALVDVVVVSFNSRAHLRACIVPLLAADDIRVIVVDNRSPDRSLEAISDLDVLALPQPRNGGFAYGCNAGWRAGSAPYVLFLNPDASIEPAAVRQLARTLERDPAIGLVGPRIVTESGEVDRSQFDFATPGSYWLYALLAHRAFARARWATGTITDPAAYEQAGSPDWLSGACMALRRSTLERLRGLDEGFFMYCEDMDLCSRLRSLGLTVRYDPAAVATHEGGASSDGPDRLRDVLVSSRIRYVGKHFSRTGRVIARAAIALAETERTVLPRGDRQSRATRRRAWRISVGLAAAPAPGASTGTPAP
jgi:GT2 family glycosyltransferase